jgi:multidrug efflux pump subunit AcrA (membrane-fusion protein)
MRVGDRAVKGRVVRVSDELQKATGLAEVLVEIPDAGEGLPVGAFVQARVPRESSESVVTIPRAALLGCSEGQFVYTVSGEHLVRTAVKVGASNQDWVEIIDGLYAGDQVVAQPVMSLWLTELAAVKGGQACCAEPPKGK